MGRKRKKAVPAAPLRQRLHIETETGLTISILIRALAILAAPFNRGEVQTRRGDGAIAALTLGGLGGLFVRDAAL